MCPKPNRLHTSRFLCKQGMPSCILHTNTAKLNAENETNRPFPGSVCPVVCTPFADLMRKISLGTTVTTTTLSDKEAPAWSPGDTLDDDAEMGMELDSEGTLTVSK